MRMQVCAVLTVVAMCVQAGWADEPRTADEVIAKYVEALGGHDKLMARKTLRVTAKMSMPQDMEAEAIQESKRPDKYRQDTTLMLGKKPLRMVQAFDGTTWWHIMPMMGQAEPQEVPADMAKAYAGEADVDGPLVDAEKKGHKVELIGREELDGKSIYRLKVTLKGAAKDEYDDYYIDAKSWLPAKVISRRTVMGIDTTIEKRFEDYRSEDGVMVAHTQRTAAVPEVGEYVQRIIKVETNIDLPDERFSLEAAKKVAAATSAPAPKDMPAGPVKDDPAAHKLYDGMIAAFRAADTLSFESQYDLEIGAFPGVGCSYKAWLKKPNYFRVEAFGPKGKRAGILIGDGEAMWIHWPQGRPRFSTGAGEEPNEKYEATKHKVYMSKAAPPKHHSIGHEVGLLGSGIIMNILDLSTFHGYTDSLQPLMDGVARHGTEEISGDQCDVLDVSFMDGQRVWRLWISQGDHLPRKLSETVHVANDIHAEEVWSNIRINKKMRNKRFAWRPPDDWKQWYLPETEQALLKPGTEAPDFKLKLADGKTASLSDYRGKMVWLVFWRAG